MRICIDAVPLLFRSAGIKNYLYHWLRHLRDAGAREKITAFPWIEGLGDLHHENSVAGPVGTLTRLAALHFLNLPGNHAMDLLGGRPDVFHSCKLLNPPRKAKLTATIQDLTAWLFPNTHTPDVVRFEQAFADKIYRHADGLIAASHSTRDDAAQILKIDPGKIEVIYHGVAQQYFDITPEEIASAKSRHELERPYILYIGTIEPRKNIDHLLDAFAALEPTLGGEVELVLAGPRGWAKPGTVNRLAMPSCGVRYLGYVPEAELPGILGGAAVLAYPSLYEGFGFPLAQALAAGVPVVTSNVSSMPEIAGDAAVLIDPHSTESLVSGLKSVLLSPSLAGRLREAGKVRAREFTWENCARQSLRFFEKVAGR